MRPRHPFTPALARALSTLAGLIVLAYSLPAMAGVAEISEQVAGVLNAALKSRSALAYVFCFAGGVLTSLTPCVYPLIPITMSVFGARGENVKRSKSMLLASAYVGGIATMYTSMGVLSALTGRAFGTHLSSPWLIVPIALFFFAMAASMFGAFELNLPQGLQARLTTVGGSGFGGAFIMGLVSGLIAAPCVGPVLLSLLAFVASSGSVFFGGSLMFVYALGMGVLFFVLAASARSLPRSGGWMDSVKSLFGIVMIIAALYFLRNVSSTLKHIVGHEPKWGWITSALLVVGVAIGGVHLSWYGSMAEKARKVAGIVLAIAGGFGVLSWMLTAPPFAWVQGEPAAVEQGRSQGRPVLLDFSAEWCGPCQEMEVTVFGKEEVREALARFVPGKVDCTDDNEAVDAVKAKYGASTLPTVVLIDSAGNVAKKWNREIDARELLEALPDVR